MKITKHRLSTIVLATILTVATFLRLYRLEATQQFLGDQGRDALIVSKIFKDFDLVFIGPVTSIGNLYLGPLYYYFMVPWLWLTYPSPMGPIVAVAVIGIVTVYLLYRLGKELVGEAPALVATALYAVSAVVIQLTRFSWNPNPSPLFGLLVLYSLHRVWQGHRRHWIWLGVWSAILLQLHYMYLLALGGIGIVWIYLFKQADHTRQRWNLIKSALASLGILLVSFTPLVLFDIKHHGVNANAFYRLLFTKEGIYHQDTSNTFSYLTRVMLELHGRAMNVMTELFLGQHRQINTILIVGLIVLIVKWYRINRNRSLRAGVSIILALLLTGIIGSSFYGHSVFSHYIAYLFPAVFLILGLSLVVLWQWHLLGKFIAVIFVGWYLSYNLVRLPLKPAGWQIKDIANVAQTITQHIGDNEKYSLVLFSETGDLDGMNYRYFLYTLGKPPVDKKDSSEVDAVVIINEGAWEKPVTDSPVWDIVTFPSKNPSEVYQIPDGPTITVLRRSKR